VRSIDSRLRSSERRAFEVLCPDCRSRPAVRAQSEKEILRVVAEIQADILANESAEELEARAQRSEEWAAWYRAIAASRA
jgi:hypothetical protein